MCLYPKLITNRKYVKTKKNGGKIPPVPDERVKLVPVGCGKCIECRKQKARSWQIRLLEDIKKHKNGKFITLTFSNESIWKITQQLENKEATGYDLDNAIATKAVRLFVERWRKKYKKSVRHWLVTELGHNGTENIHLHGILWTNESYENIAKIWQYGFIWPKPEHKQQTWVNNQTINYIIKYVNKTDEDHKTYKSIILTSPQIGANYMERTDWKNNTFKQTQTNETYKTPTGHKINLPIYYRNKIYTEEQREKLWLQKLDKNERWVCGQKIPADDFKAYWALIEFHRERNRRLGYGNDEKDWNTEQYEQQRRKLQQQKRIQNARHNTLRSTQKNDTIRTTRNGKGANEKQNGKNNNT